MMTEKQLVATVDKAIKKFHGDSTTLESAIGMLMVGRLYGWKVMLLVHDKKTIKKYEDILGINIREELPEVAELSHRSYAWKAVQGLSNFWKAVKGEVPGVRTPDFSR